MVQKTEHPKLDETEINERLGFRESRAKKHYSIGFSFILLGIVLINNKHKFERKKVIF